MSMREKGKNGNGKDGKPKKEDRKPWDCTKKQADEARKALSPFSSKPMDEKLRNAIKKANIWEGSLQRGRLAGPTDPMTGLGHKMTKRTQQTLDELENLEEEKPKKEKKPKSPEERFDEFMKKKPKDSS